MEFQLGSGYALLSVDGLAGISWDFWGLFKPWASTSALHMSTDFCERRVFQLHLLLFFPRNCMCGLLSYFHSKWRNMSQGSSKQCNPGKFLKGDMDSLGKGVGKFSAKSPVNLFLLSGCFVHVSKISITSDKAMFLRIQTATWFGGSHNNSSTGQDDSSTQRVHQPGLWLGNGLVKENLGENPLCHLPKAGGSDHCEVSVADYRSERYLHVCTG